MTAGGWLTRKLSRLPRGGSRSRIHSTFASLRVRNYRLYFIGQSVSVAGSWMQNVALSWYVLQLTGSGVQLGFTVAIRYLPLLLLGPWGGLVTDRMDRRRLLLATQIAAAVLSGLLAIGVAVNLASLAMVYVVSGLLGLVNVLSNPGRQTFVNELVPNNLLANAIVLNSVSGNVARVIGPVISGALIASVGVSLCLAANALSFGAVIYSLARMDREDLTAAEKIPRARRQLRAGFAYVWRTPQLLIPLIMTTVVGTFAWEFQVTLPLIASGAFHRGSLFYGIMLACVGVGAMVGAFVVAGRPATASAMGVARSGVFWGISILLAALAPFTYLEFAALILVGYGTISFNSLAKTSLQVTAAPPMLGRVMALWAVTWQGTTPIGGPTVGWIGDTFGARWSLMAGALPTIAVCVIAMPFLRRAGTVTPHDVDGVRGRIREDVEGTDPSKLTAI